MPRARNQGLLPARDRDVVSLRGPRRTVEAGLSIRRTEADKVARARPLGVHGEDRRKVEMVVAAHTGSQHCALSRERERKRTHWLCEMATMSTPGKCPTAHGASRIRLGPNHVTGEARAEKMGSKRTLRVEDAPVDGEDREVEAGARSGISTNAPAWPTQVPQMTSAVPSLSPSRASEARAARSLLRCLSSRRPQSGCTTLTSSTASSSSRSGRPSHGPRSRSVKEGR